MRQGGGAGGSALSIWVRALAEGGEAAGEIKSDAAGHQSDWASGILQFVISAPPSGSALRESAHICRVRWPCRRKSVRHATSGKNRSPRDRL